MKMVEKPLQVTVVIPSYNHKAYVADAIRSVLNQEGKDFTYQLLVMDDGSTDGSVDLLLDLQKKAELSFELVLKKNEGLCRTLNRAIREYSTGHYIAVLASDDMWRKDKLQKQIQLLLENASSELCYSNAQKFSDNGLAGKSSRIMFDGDVTNRLTLYNFIPAGTILFSRTLYDLVGGFDETGLRLEDWDFLLRASAVTEFCYIDEELLYYRLHDESSIAKMRERGILYQEKMKVLCKNKEILNPFLRFCSIFLHFSLDAVLRPFISKLRAK
ncbi:glycosyltransferase [Pseudomonas sp. NyZ704]|nr:glycosyltransferase [Pseudomonas sp. NyZ704]